MGHMHIYSSAAIAFQDTHRHVSIYILALQLHSGYTSACVHIYTSAAIAIRVHIGMYPYIYTLQLHSRVQNRHVPIYILALQLHSGYTLACIHIYTLQLHSRVHIRMYPCIYHRCNCIPSTHWDVSIYIYTLRLHFEYTWECVHIFIHCSCTSSTHRDVSTYLLSLQLHIGDVPIYIYGPDCSGLTQVASCSIRTGHVQNHELNKNTTNIACLHLVSWPNKNTTNIAGSHLVSWSKQEHHQHCRKVGLDCKNEYNCVNEYSAGLRWAARTGRTA